MDHRSFGGLKVPQLWFDTATVGGEVTIPMGQPEVVDS